MRTLWLAALCLSVATAAQAQTAAEIEHGKRVYAAEKCRVCHSVEGDGNTRGPLDGVGSKLTVEEIRQWMIDAPEMTAKTKSERRPLMRSYPHLSAEDLNAVIAYMVSLKK